MGKASSKFPSNITGDRRPLSLTKEEMGQTL